MRSDVFGFDGDGGKEELGVVRERGLSSSVSSSPSDRGMRDRERLDRALSTRKEAVGAKSVSVLDRSRSVGFRVDRRNRRARRK